MFDTSKVTDHHAIIPTGVPAQGLSDAEQHVFDLIARRFIGAFYPECKFSTTTVLGKAGEVEFKVTGKEILDPGWRVVQYVSSSQQQPSDEDDKEKKDEEHTLPTFVKGESGPHTPTLTEKMTTPPPYYTEATLLRAMETAGKFVEDEELRAALKENGIGRPSSRAGIIETLFKRHYIRRERKRLVATPTGIELIDLIKKNCSRVANSRVSGRRNSATSSTRLTTLHNSSTNLSSRLQRLSDRSWLTTRTAASP